MTLRCVLLACLLAAAAPVLAQEHRPDPVFKVGSGLLLAGHGADLWSTAKCIGAQTCHEANPLLRPFESTSITFGMVKMGMAAAQLYALEQLHKHSRRWGRVAVFALAGGTVALAVRNDREGRRGAR